MPECEIVNQKCGGECTGYSGEHIWAERKQVNAKIECDTCRENAEKLETFTHDVVNAKLGKPIFNKKNFKTHAKQIECICKNNPGLC